MIQVEVSNLFFTETDASGVTLIEKNGNRKLQIVVGDFEAQAIALAMENIKPPRPITHDLIVSILETSEVNIEKLLINDLKNNTYYAILFLDINGINKSIDTRPSDGIAIAVRMGIPIFVEEHVMEIAAQNEHELKVEPKSSKSISHLTEDELQTKLKEAVENENYELAAKIRDELNKKK